MNATLDTQTQTPTQAQTWTRLTQLDYRENDGIEVSLLWSRDTGKVTVHVWDTRTDESFELAADPAHAREVFNHPYAYASHLAA